MNSRTLSVFIEADPGTVYRFASNPANLPQWLPSFVLSVEVVNGTGVLQTTAGPMTFTFVEENSWGILDHSVILPDGTEVLNPMRVVGTGPGRSGSTVLFTLLQTPGMTDDQFNTDAGMVQRDLNTLKQVLERKG